MKYDRRTREQRKVDSSTMIALICFGLIALLAAAALSTDAGGAEQIPEESSAVERLEGEDTPATGCAYITESPLFYEITADDRRTLECIVQGEAGGESYEGKLWVATCLLNAMRKDDLSAEETRVAYQYAGWSNTPSDDSIRAVSAVFDDGEVVHDRVLWFYAPQLCTSAWHESQEFVAEIGGHRFFAWEGSDDRK